MNGEEVRPSRRRWFQFGLGTALLVMACISLWLAREVNIVQERLRQRQWLFERGGRENYRNWWWPIRRFLGDKPSANIFPPSDLTDEEMMALKTAFPEAYFFGRQLDGVQTYEPHFDRMHPETIGQKPSGPRRLAPPNP